MKRTLPRFAVLSLLPLLVPLGGCISIGARSAAVAKPTLGQQLLDLQKARDSGALAPAEYELQRERLLAGAPAAQP
jgi:hypothetical protein